MFAAIDVVTSRNAKGYSKNISEGEVYFPI